MPTTRTTITKTTGIKRKAAAPKKGGISPLAIALAGGAVGVGLYFIFKDDIQKLFKGETAAAPRPRLPAEQIAPLPPVTSAPLSNIGAVSTRVGQLVELWRMGDITPPAALRETDTLVAATTAFLASNPAIQQEATDILARIASLRDDIIEYQQLQNAIV